MSTILVDNLTGKTSAGSITVTSEGGAATQSLQQGLAKAWVNFNGTGTVAILDSLNASSITDSATGRYRHNFSSSTNSSSYSSNYSTNGYTGGYTSSALVVGEAAQTTSQVSVEGIWAGSYQDSSSCMNTLMGDLA